ncbi:MAG: polyphosphate:AMP phosphotransferase [Pseudomonadota bacterium]
MFESAELGHRIDKETFAREEPKLRSALLAAQYELLAQQKTAVVVLIGGVDGAGKGETVNLFNEWMDPRHIQTHAFSAPSDEEDDRPPMWRYWRALPSKGRIGMLFGSWYTDPVVERVAGRLSKSALDRRIEEIRHFERMLVQENVLLVKLWFHLSKKAQRKRLKELEKDPDTRWRVTRQDWKRFDKYDRFRKVSEHTLRETSTGEAPWLVIEGTDHRYRSLTAGRLLLAALRDRLAAKEPPAPVRAAPLPKAAIDGRNVLVALDYRLKIPKKKYEQQLEKWQGELNLLSRHPKFRKHSVVCVFEGHDAAGKGGAIRRITQALDARHYTIVPVAAPTEEERARPYLWRFWRHLPRQGHFTIFDRSWYGRVLVERVEGFCSEDAWMRAYSEINDFEEQMDRHGIVVAKFWLAITAEEQLKRFREREKTEYKKFKITDEDWRNRKKWPQYERAVCDMIDRTSTEIAPWTLVEANDKYHARIKVLKTLCEQLENGLR